MELEGGVSQVKFEKKTKILNILTDALQSCLPDALVWMRPGIKSKWVLNQIETIIKEKGSATCQVTFKNKDILNTDEFYTKYTGLHNIVWVPAVSGSLSLTQALLCVLASDNEPQIKQEFDFTHNVK